MGLNTMPAFRHDRTLPASWMRTVCARSVMLDRGDAQRGRVVGGEQLQFAHCEAMQVVVRADR